MFVSASRYVGIHILTWYTARVPLPLHLSMVEDPPGLPARQPRLGIPEIWSLGFAFGMAPAELNKAWDYKTNVIYGLWQIVAPGERTPRS